jgi:outer membrane lipoprotein-sorting protein
VDVSLPEVGMNRMRMLGLLFAGGVSVGTVEKLDRPEVKVDPRALAMMKDAEAAIQNAASVSAELTAGNTYGGPYSSESQYVIQLRKPNYIRLVHTTTNHGVRRDTVKKEDVPYTNVSETRTLHDGTFRYEVTQATCSKRPLPVINESRELDHFQNSLFWTFFDLGEWQFRSHLGGLWHTKFNMRDPGLRSLTYSGRETVDGVAYDVVTWTYKNKLNLPKDDHLYTTKFYLGSDKLIHRVVSEGPDQKSSQVYKNIKLNDSSLTPASFAYNPPDGVACKDVDPESGYTSGNYVDLPIGSVAPDFVAKDASGKNVRFYDLIKGKKAVLLDFTGYG